MKFRLNFLKVVSKITPITVERIFNAYVKKIYNTTFVINITIVVTIDQYDVRY